MIELATETSAGLRLRERMELLDFHVRMINASLDTLRRMWDENLEHFAPFDRSEVYANPRWWIEATIAEFEARKEVYVKWRTQVLNELNNLRRNTQ